MGFNSAFKGLKTDHNSHHPHYLQFILHPITLPFDAE